MWRSFVENTFVDDGDTQLVTNRFDRNTYCTVSGGSFVYSFSFLKNWSMQSYSATYDYAPLTSSLQKTTIYNKKYTKLYFAWDVGFRVLKI